MLALTCKNFNMYSNTRRFESGNDNISSSSSLAFSQHLTQSLYRAVGITGSVRSRSQYFKSDAGTFGSEMPLRSYLLFSILMRCKPYKITPKFQIKQCIIMH